MDISQLNSKTVYLKKAGVEFLIQYFYIWNGINKQPESVILRNNSIDAFFLTSVIKDAITETEHGFMVQRRWSIIPGGNLQLSFCLDIVVPSQIPFLVPCLVSGGQLPEGAFTILGERLSHPAAVTLFPDDRGIFLCSGLPESDNEFSSLHISRSRLDRYHCVRAEVCRPPHEQFPADFSSRKGFIQGQPKSAFQSPGNLEQNLTLHVLLAKGRDIYPVVANYVHEIQIRKSALRILKDPRDLGAGIKKQIGSCLEDLLVADKGICGLKDTLKSSTLSISSSLGLSLLIQILYKSKTDLHETSLRLADFCLKAQHPSGLFLDSYFVNEKKWFPAELFGALKSGKQAETLLTLQHSAGIAQDLLLLCGELKAKDFFYNTYFAAAASLLDFFFDKGETLNTLGEEISLVNLKFEKSNLRCLELVFPLLAIYKLTGDEKYKKAILVLKNDFFSSFLPYFQLPSVKVSETGSDQPDFETALLLLRAANVFSELGVQLQDTQMLVNNILPWIYYNKGHKANGLDLRGAILDSFSACRLTCRGFELSYELLKFRGICDQAELVATIEKVAGDVIAFALRTPTGRPFIYHTLWQPEGKPAAGNKTADFSSHSFVRESRFLLYLVRDFADFLKG